MKDFKVICKLCGSSNGRLVETLRKKPAVEVDYGIQKNSYLRSVYNCKNCGVYFNQHQLIDFEKFYHGQYNEQIDPTGLNRRFQRIIAIPPHQSDNKGRVKRVIDYLSSFSIQVNEIDALDVGSGTCVFSYELGKHVKSTSCIDPDEMAIKHALEVVKVQEAHCGSIFDYSTNKKFDLITFNKVLEHVIEPIRHLQKASEFLKPGGTVYVELPEGDRIFEEGQVSKRAEFAVEHHTIFNEKSMNFLADKAGFAIREIDVITDPSGKYTILGFLVKK